MSNQETESPKAEMSSGPARMMSNQMATYYSNCAIVATSPRDISLFFGRYVPVPDNKGSQTLAEMYERQIYMTIEQAEDLVRMLAKTLEVYRSRKASAEQKGWDEKTLA